MEQLMLLKLIGFGLQPQQMLHQQEEEEVTP
jgi:hypothetical protein